MELVSLEKGHSKVSFLLGVNDCHALVEGGTSVRRGDLLIKWPHKNSDPFTMQRLLIEFSWVVSAAIAHVLLIYATGNVKMGLVAKEHEHVRGQVFQERFTRCLASVKITFSELLHYCHFVWMKAKFFVKDSSHRAVRIPQGSCMFASRTSRRTHKRLPHRLNVFGCSDALCRSLVFFSTFPLTLNAFTHKAIDCRLGSGAPARILNRVRKARWVAKTDRPFEK